MENAPPSTFKTVGVWALFALLLLLPGALDIGLGVLTMAGDASLRGVARLLASAGIIGLVLFGARAARLWRAGRGAPLGGARLAFETAVGGICWLAAVSWVLVLTKGVVRYNARIMNRSNIESMRAALAVSYGLHDGRYPLRFEDLRGKASKDAPPWEGAWPTLWRGGAFRHADNDVVDDVPKKVFRDTGHWAYVNDPKSSDFGSLYIDCTHVDDRGRAWTSY